jgi:hypothetical protein
MPLDNFDDIRRLENKEEAIWRSVPYTTAS